MEDLEHLPLVICSQVDQHIAAAHQIQPRERGIFGHVVQRKDTPLTHRPDNAIAPFLLIDWDKEPFQATSRDGAQRVCWIDSSTGVLEYPGIDIRRKKVDGWREVSLL